MLWFSIDFITTSYYSSRGFSKFFTSDKLAGHINNPNFSGYFGGPLDDFYSKVNIGSLGERISIDGCSTPKKTVLFLGDSSVAGFEVDDNETFTSVINKDCKKTNILAYNFGVRAHDTHNVIGNYSRIQEKIDHNLVYYLITPNDITENMKKFHYVNIVKRFGRVFEGEHYKYNLSYFEKTYFQLRIFISDNFYLTTKLLSYAENFDAKRQYAYEKLTVDSKLKLRMSKLKELIIVLNNLVVKNDAKLIVSIYPCPGTPQCNSIEYERLLKEILKDEKIIVHELTESLLLRENKNLNLEDMRFRNDPHLSVFGHSIIGKMIEDFLLNISISD